VGREQVCGFMVAAAAWTALVLSTTPALAQPVARAAVAETAPLIDGQLDDAVWKSAPAYEGFVERTPQIGAKPPVGTRFWIAVDADALYVAVHNEDDGEIRARTRRRDDGAIFNDDAISLKIDAARDGRTTLGFVINPGGARLDYRGVNEEEFRTEYDTIWQGAAMQGDDGWTAEFAIPWSSLGINPSSPPSEVGLNFSRDHSRRTATYDWSLMPPPFSPIAASLYGRLTGLEVLRELADDESILRSWAIQPFAVAGFRSMPGAVRDRRFDSLLEGGFDARATFDAVRGHLTVNTDFAQVDLDNQVVNLTRFGLFLPEKRDFFLEDVELFSFGRVQQAQMFYSRRIGLGPDATPIPILAGAKVVGTSEVVRGGVLEVTTRPLDGTPWTSHGIGRAVAELGGGSNAGLMVTHRQSLEATGDRNLNIGFDGAYRGRRVPLFAQAFVLGSLTGAEAGDPLVATGGDGRGAFADRVAPGGGVSVTLRDRLVRPRLGYAFYHPELRSDLGFLQRVGIHEGTAGIELEPRIDRGGVNRINTGIDGAVIAAWEGEVLDWRGTWFAQVRSTSGFVAGGIVTRRLETVQEPFTVGRETTIDAGEYPMWVGSIYGNTPSTEVVAAQITLTGRDYYGGTLLEAAGSLSWAPAALVRFDVGSSYDRVTFDDRSDFDSFLVNGRVSFGFTPLLGLRLFTGYNLLSDVLQVQSRLRWTYLPSADLFVVAQADLDDDAWTPRFGSIVIKTTFRFP
jgi:hypothetical protein